MNLERLHMAAGRLLFAAIAAVLCTVIWVGTAQAGAVINGTWYADWESYSFAQQSEIRRFHSCERASDCTIRQNVDSQPSGTASGTYPPASATGPGTVGAPEPKTTALSFFDAGMGLDGTSSCLSCNFMSFFMIALSDFSFMVFQYFYNIFVALAPPTLLVWLGYRAAKLMIMGGENGRDFLYGVVGKSALFAIVWLIATGANNYSRYMWEATGPLYLDFAFTLSNEIRDATIGSTNLASTSGGGDVVFCNDVQIPALGGGSLASFASDPKYIFVEAAVKSACFTERAHILGMASGVALAFDSYGGAAFGWTDIGGWLNYLITVIFKSLIGLFVVIVYTISAIWLIFLVLDVVTRGLITAAFSPLLAALYLYQPTRSITTGAIKAMGGAIFTAIALAMISVLAYVLVTNTVNVYKVTHPPIVASYEEWGDKPGEVPGFENFDSNRLASMREFIQYIGEGDPDKMHIPMDFGTPWFWYMAFCGVAIFALGKKMIAMLEGLVGYQGASTFADSAMKSIRTGAVGAVAGTAVTAGIAGIAAKGMGKAGTYAAGGATGIGGQALGGAGAAMGWAGNKLSSPNILSASGLAMRAAQSVRPENE